MHIMTCTYTVRSAIYTLLYATCTAPVQYFTSVQYTTHADASAGISNYMLCPQYCICMILLILAVATVGGLFLATDSQVGGLVPGQVVLFSSRWSRCAVM